MTLRAYFVHGVVGDKSGGSEKRFYKQLIKKADARFDAHVERLEEEARQERRRKK